MKNLRFSQLSKMPTSLDNKHESLYRSYHILALVKDLLKKGTPADVVLGVIGEAENLPYLEQAVSDVFPVRMSSMLDDAISDQQSTYVTDFINRKVASMREPGTTDLKHVLFDYSKISAFEAIADLIRVCGVESVLSAISEIVPVRVEVKDA